MKKLRANVCAVTHAGRVRRENEDNYDLNGRMTSTGDLKKGSAFVQSMAEPFHLSVCDGMGGESYGDIASGIAVETIAAHAANVYESGEDFSFAISNCLDDANSRICAEINARGKRMGTTLAAIYAVKGKIICVNIGDTRIYHYSKGILEQISFDHTHAQTIVDAGQVSQNNISRIPDAKRLTRHLGVFPEGTQREQMARACMLAKSAVKTGEPNISVIDDIDDGDIVLLCSDGLTDMLGDEDITAILSTGESAQDVASKLIKRALERGGKDNVTVMAAFIGVEETAIFAPIAAAMVGDTDADYEEEYRNSYGSNQLPDEENPVSPYANADARAYVKPVDKAKIIKIAGIAVGAVAALVILALVIKAMVGGKSEESETTDTTTYYYAAAETYPLYTQPTYQQSLTTWVFEPTSESETSSTEATTKRVTTTRKPSTTKKKPTATKKPSSTKKPTEAQKTTAAVSSTEAHTENTTAPNTSEQTTQPSTASENTTEKATETQAPTDAPTNAPEQPAGNGENANPAQ